MREGMVALFVVVALGAGLAIDAVSPDVETPRPTAFEGDLVTSRAVFCAPSSAEAGTVRVAVAAARNDRGYRVGIETAVPDSVATEATPEPPAEVEGTNAIIARADGNEAVDVVGYDQPIQGGTLLATSKPLEGAGAAQCSPDASETWFFAAGSTTLDSDERILLYNPFPDEAVVRLSFYTPRGLETKTSVTDIPVPAGSWKSVAINEVIRTRPLVAVGVTAHRGRVVAWREMFSEPKGGPTGVQLSLGAREPSRRWYFPDGAVGEGFEERISILNPTSRQAVVEITLATTRETVQPPDLVEATIPSRSAATFSLAKARTRLTKTTGVSATVRSTNGVGIVAERTIRYLDTNVGVTAEVGAAAPARRWLLSPAALSPASDALILFNPGVEGVRVRAVMLDVKGDPLRLGQLQNLRVPAGKRLHVPLEELAEGRPVTVIVDAEGPVVAERFSYSSRSGDAAAVMGVPVTPAP